MISPEKHFDEIASEYDFWKKKNFYYYKNLIALYKSFIPENSSVLEIGCGTGDIIAALNPRKGVGIDVSASMIELAKRKYLNRSSLEFYREDITNRNSKFDCDFVFLADVLEHVPNLESFIKKLYLRTPEHAKIIISVANPRWEWLLMIAEKLGMKMPEGPHARLSINETEKIFTQAGFLVSERGYRLLVPKKLPGADLVNSRFYRSRFLSNFGFIVYWVIRKR